MQLLTTILSFIHNPYGLISTIVFVAGVIFIVIIILKAILSVKELAIGKVRFSTKSVCIPDIVCKTTDVHAKTAQIKKEIYCSQYRQAKEKVEEMAHTMQTHFIRLLMAGQDIPFIDHPSYKVFVAIKDTIVAYVLSYICNRLEENHLAFYTPEAQVQYVEERKKYIMRKTTELITVYWCCTNVTRKELTNMNRPLLAYYESTIASIFNEAFAISRDGYKRIQKIEQDYYDYIKQYTQDDSLDNLL